MKEVGDVIKIVAELMQYFLQQTFFAMLINYGFNKKHSKISINLTVNNSTV
jgi:hypothetical protein